jgi:hypothetical protein
VHRRNDHILHLELVIFDRIVAAGLAANQHRRRELLARAAELLQVDGRGVDVLGDLQIADIGLAGATPLRDVHAATLGHAPGP